MANLVLNVPRFVIFDTKNDYDAAFFGNDVKVCADVYNFGQLLNAGVERIIFDLSALGDECEEILSVSLLTLNQFQLANMQSDLAPVTVLLDELNRFVTDRHAPEGIKEIVQRGRSVKIEKVFGAQWFGTIPAWVRDSFTEIYTFQHNDPAGLQRLEQAGFDPVEVKNLPRYTVLHNGGDKIERIRLAATGEEVQETNKAEVAATA